MLFGIVYMLATEFLLNIWALNMNLFFGFQLSCTLCVTRYFDECIFFDQLVNAL